MKNKKENFKNCGIRVPPSNFKKKNKKSLKHWRRERHI